jgi:DNA-binding transcriptional LysR family regulator
VDGWPGVEPRHLAALAAVHDERSFRAAADRLGYVQSAVSLQIAQLERLVGARLVERERGHGPPVTLTAAGTLLLAHGTSILTELGGAHDDLRAAAAPPLRLGLPRGATAAGLGLDVVVEPRYGLGDRELHALVAAGELDAALAAAPDDDTLAAVHVLTDPIILLVAASDPGAAVTCAAGLIARPLIARDGRPLPAGAEALLRASDDAIVQALVGAGCGAALMPSLAVAPGDPATIALATGDLLPPHRFALCHRHGELPDALRRALTPPQGPIASPAAPASIAGAVGSSAAASTARPR